MSDLAMDLTTNDLLITNGDLSLVVGIDAIQQDLQQTLQVWLGEWFLDTTFGIAFRQQILVKNPNMDLVQADLVAAAASVPGIVQILDMSFTFDGPNRDLSVSVSAQTTTGETITVQTSISAQTAVGTIEGKAYP